MSYVDKDAFIKYALKNSCHVDVQQGFRAAMYEQEHGARHVLPDAGDFLELVALDGPFSSPQDNRSCESLQ